MFDLFASLEATDEQLDFPTLFASGRNGWAAESLEAERVDMKPLFELVRRHVPPPKVAANKDDANFTMLVTTLEANPYLGRILTGRIETGTARANMQIKSLSR